MSPGCIADLATPFNILFIFSPTALKLTGITNLFLFII